MDRNRAITELVEIRRKWRNNGSTIEFGKEEGLVFQAFRKSNADWETSWPAVQLESHKQIE